MPKSFVPSLVVPAGFWLLLGVVGCGASESAPRKSDSGGAGGNGPGAAGTGTAGDSASPGTAGMMAGNAAITDGSARCRDLSASGTFAGRPLGTQDGWVSFGVWVDDLSWFGRYAWPDHLLRLRGPAAPGAAFVEGSLLQVANGYLVRADTTPWQAACVTSASTVRMVNANDVLDLELAAAATCGGQLGTDHLDICFASPAFSAHDPEPPCARGVTGTLDGQAAPQEPATGVSGQPESSASVLSFGNYELRLPLSNWSLDSPGGQEFTGGLLIVQRPAAYDLYCAAKGRTGPSQITVEGLSKLSTCDASARAVDSIQLCHWDFTRER